MTSTNEHPVFIVHYSKLIERKLFLDYFLNDKFSKIEFITKYDQENLNLDLINKFYKEDSVVFNRKIFELWQSQNFEYRKLSVAEISCFLKHIEAIKSAANSESHYSLILEDDVLPFKNFNFRYKKIIKNLNKKDWDVAFVGKGIGLKFIYNKLGIRILSAKPQKVNHPASNCAEAYFIKKTAALKLLEKIITFNLSYDWELAYQMYKLNLNVLWATRPLFKQGSQTGKYKSSLR